MSIRHVTALIAGALAISAFTSWTTAADAEVASKPAAHRKPNVIVILADDLGYHDLGVQG